MEKIEKFLVIEVDYSVLLPKNECNYLYKLKGRFGRFGYVYCQYIITSKLKGFLVYNALLFKNFKIKGDKRTGDIEIYYENNKKPEKVKRLVVKNAKKFINSWKEDITIFKWDNKKFGVPVNMVKNNPNNRTKYLIYKRKEEEK